MADWPSWDVFLRPRGGLSHQHVGAVHAPDAGLALQLARDLYTRRGEGVSLWVAPSTCVVPADEGAER
jgi:ring-1,2-phenylacetyl-CoA epoxidase subunit PaaB